MRLVNKSLTSNMTAKSSVNPRSTAARPSPSPRLFDPAPPSSPWDTNLRKTTLLRHVTNVEDDMESKMRDMNINEAAQDKFLDPSVAPLPAAGPSNYRQGTNAPTENSEQASRAINAKHCVRTQRTVADFRKGHIISLPTHVPNLDPKKTTRDRRVCLTCVGPAYSNGRMYAIMWLNDNDMTSLPLHSFGDRGLAGRPDRLKRNYVCVRNVGASTEWINHGLYDPVDVEVYDTEKRMLNTSTIKLTGGRGIDPQEDISIIGRLTEESYNHLEALWESRSLEARRKPW